MVVGAVVCLDAPYGAVRPILDEIAICTPQALLNMHQLQPKFLREILSADADAESDGAGDARSRFEEIFGRLERTTTTQQQQQ